MKEPRIIRTIPIINVQIIAVPTDLDKFSRSRAPKYWLTIMELPVPIMIKKIMSKCTRGAELPIALRASSPTYCPTTTLSTVLYICCAMFPTKRGRLKYRIFFQGVPTVISCLARKIFDIESPPPENFVRHFLFSCLQTIVSYRFIAVREAISK